MTATYLSPTSFRRSAVAELRGWALLAACLALTSAFVAAIWGNPAQAASAAAPAPCWVASR